MNESQSAPIVLVHGILGFNQLKLAGLKVADYFRLIPDGLRNDGHVVPDPPQLNPAGSIAERAQDLKNYLHDANNGQVFDKKVHIFAHSMGGLDTRFMISKLGMADRVLSLTTIGTPHHGSPIADIVAAGTHPAVRQTVEHLGIDVKGAFDLTTDACRQFNNDVPDAPGVRYFSIAGQFEPPRTLAVPRGLLGLAHDIIAIKQNGNDGLVSVASANLPERSGWTSLDVWEVDHFRLVNWGMDILPTLSESGDHTILTRYRTLVARVKELVAQN